MTAVQAYHFASSGGANDFAEVIAICETSGPYCLIGGLALNSYIDPVYTLDADLVIAGNSLEELLTGKILAFSDPTRRLSKRKKDELDLIRIGESYPHLISLMPKQIQDQF
jgi:hypothetical protein